MNKVSFVWSMVGKSINGTSVKDALRDADLGFTVKKTQLLGVDPNKVCREQVATFREDTGDILGVVGPKYGIVNNEDAFDFADLIPNLKWIRGGYTYTGMAFLVGQLPEVEISGESYTPHIVFQNSFNGRWNLKGQVVLVDENDHTVTLPGKTDIKIRHARRAESRVRKATQAMAAVNDYIAAFSQEADEYVKHLIDDAALEVVVSDMFPVKPGASDRVRDNQLQKRDEFLKSYRDPCNANWHGTAWGLVKAFADFSAKAGVKASRKTAKKAERVFQNTLVGGKSYKRLMNIIANV